MYTGEIISIEYEGSTEVCTGGNGGGGGGSGGGPSPEEIFQGILASMFPVSIKLSTEFVSQTATQRTRIYPRIFYFVPPNPVVGSTAFTFISREMGTQYLHSTGYPQGDIWRWSSLTNLGVLKLGTSAVLDVNISGQQAVSQLNMATTNDAAKMTLTYNVAVSFVFNAFTANSTDIKTSQCVWALNYNWNAGE